MKKLILATLMILSAGAAHAADAYKFKNLGFSADGRYYAFVEHVIQDGSGFPAAHGQVIDVAQNKLLKLETVVLEDEKATEKQAIDQLTAKLQLNRYGIDGRNPGQTLWIRVPTDLSPAAKVADFGLDYWVNGGASYVAKHTLTLTEMDAPKEHECFWEQDSKMIKLTLENQSGRYDLQVDQRQPKSRACSFAYQIRQVIRFKEAVAAILRYETMGFEGPDYSTMVVTAEGVLK